MDGHKAIFRAIALGAHTEADSREMDQVLEAEVDLTKVPMLADQGLPVRLSQEMPQDSYYCKEPGHILRFCDRREEDERRLKRGSSNMMANIDSQFETDEGYENYDDLYDEQVEYLNN